MAGKRRSDVTELLKAVRCGDREALGELFPLVYEELRALAHGQRRGWHGDFTLDTTAIVHEAYIKLVDLNGVGTESRGHFFAVAATAMRHILCNYARDRRRQKRGGGIVHATIEESLCAAYVELSDGQAEELSNLEDALERLERTNERQCRVVECRFFGGMSIEETASALGLSSATVKRDWQFARAWLYREIKGSAAEGDPS